MTTPTGPRDDARWTPGQGYGPGKDKEPPEAGKVSKVEEPVVIQSPPTPREVPGEDQLA